MSRIVILNTTGLNVGQLSHLNINYNPDRGEIGIYANLINGQKLFLQNTESFDDAISLLKKFSQTCNGTYCPPTPPTIVRQPMPMPPKH